MSFTPSAAGKGPQDRTTDHRRARASLLWRRSACCDALVYKDLDAQGRRRLFCARCDRPCRRKAPAS